ELPGPGAHPGPGETKIRTQSAVSSQRHADRDPAAADEDQVDAEEDAEHEEARSRPLRHDHQAEQEADDAGEHHPALAAATIQALMLDIALIIGGLLRDAQHQSQDGSG